MHNGISLGSLVQCVFSTAQRPRSEFGARATKHKLLCGTMSHNDSHMIANLQGCTDGDEEHASCMQGDCRVISSLLAGGPAASIAS